MSVVVQQLVVILVFPQMSAHLEITFLLSFSMNLTTVATSFKWSPAGQSPPQYPWGIASITHTIADAKIHRSSSSLYQMSHYLHVTYASLDYLQYIQCHCCVSHSEYAASSSFAFWNFLEFFFPEYFLFPAGWIHRCGACQVYRVPTVFVFVIGLFYLVQCPEMHPSDGFFVVFFFNLCLSFQPFVIVFNIAEFLNFDDAQFIWFFFSYGLCF